MISGLIELRRALHRVPELGFEEEKTQAALQEALRGVGAVRTIADTGLVVDLGAREPARRLLLRADMDALPIEEETGLEFTSSHPGMMHACGHDAHMAALVHACRSVDPSSLSDVGVRFLFQPAEEGRGGAMRAIEEGVLDGVDAAFGIHVWNELPVGTVALTHGGIMAGVVEVGFRVRGRGGHGALPHRAADPVVAAALDELILRLRDAMQMTIVVVTHELDSAFRIADRITVLDQGHILITGTVDEVKNCDDERVQDLLNRRFEEEELNADAYLRRLTGGEPL